jgi:ribosomal protein S15P/S13E
MIKKKPQQEVPSIDPQQAAAFAKGSNVTKSAKTPASDTKKRIVNIYLFDEEIHELDEHIKTLPKRQQQSRHAWIVAAIFEKMEREKSKL